MSHGYRNTRGLYRLPVSFRTCPRCPLSGQPRELAGFRQAHDVPPASCCPGTGTRPAAHGGSNAGTASAGLEADIR